MCIFSQTVEEVSSTRIFARGNDGNQFLVYQMTYASVGDLAMVLPLPVPANPSEDSVRFINLEQYPGFFDDMMNGFRDRSRSGATMDATKGATESPLAVHDVGAFEASFVPTLNDFDRLDERFRLPTDVWSQLPAYHDFGFAVFKLKGGPSRHQVHPMAFEFPRRNTTLLYFPTIHIHDGEVHSEAEFDHLLYCQATPEMKDYVGGWRQSGDSASAFMDMFHSDGIIDPNAPCLLRWLSGPCKNKDTLVGAHGDVPEPV